MVVSHAKKRCLVLLDISPKFKKLYLRCEQEIRKLFPPTGVSEPEYYI